MACVTVLNVIKMLVYTVIFTSDAVKSSDIALELVNILIQCQLYVRFQYLNDRS